MRRLQELEVGIREDEDRRVGAPIPEGHIRPGNAPHPAEPVTALHAAPQALLDRPRLRHGHVPTVPDRPPWRPHDRSSRRNSGSAKYTTKATAMTTKKGWSSAAFPRTSLMNVWAIMPAPMPFVMLWVKGMA